MDAAQGVLKAGTLRILKPALGLGLAAALVWWLFRDADLAEIWLRVQGADLGLLGLSVAVSVLVFAARAARWRYYLAPVQPGRPEAHGEHGRASRRAGGPFRSRFAAVCTGAAANLALPSGRVGEFLRAYAYRRLESVPTAAALATLVVERVMDGATIVALMFLATASPSFPADALPPVVAAAIRTIGALLGGALAVSVLFVAFPERATSVFGAMAARLLPSRWAARVAAVGAAFVTGLASLRDWRLLLPAWAWSFAVWTTQSLAMWIGFFAFDIDLPFAAALFANATVGFAVSIPAPAPGYGGLWQVGAKVALVDVYGVAEEPVLAYALVWQLATSVPIVALGLWYARRLGVSFRDAKR